MEKKSNKGLIVLVIIFGIIILGLSGFIVYDKVIKNDNTKTEEKQDNIEDKDNKQDESDSKEENKNEIVKEELTADEKFKIYADNLKQQRKEKYNGESVTITQFQDTMKSYYSCGNEFYGFTIKSDGNLYTNNGTLIDTDILTHSLIEVGNGGCSYLYYIKSDGTVSNAELNRETKKIVITDNIGNYKNIISIVQANGSDTNGGGGARTILFIDIDGNIYGI